MEKTEAPIRVFAIIPAAGQSRRMGRAKQLVEIGGKPMLSAVVDAVAASRVAGVVVVLNSKVAKEFPLASPGVTIVINDNPDSDMIDSIRIGLKHLSLASAHGYLICTGDQPGVSTVDINRCIEVFASDPTRMTIATHHGKRGHPLIFPSEMVSIVNSSVCDGGLNQLPRHFPQRVFEIESAADVIRNINSPSDL